MSKKTTIVALEDPDYGTIYFEVAAAEEDEYGNAAGGEADDSVKLIPGKLTTVLGSLRAFGKGVLDSVKDLGPNEVEVKTGLKLTVKEGKILGLIARGEAEFPFEVTLKWKFDQQDKKDQSPTG